MNNDYVPFIGDEDQGKSRRFTAGKSYRIRIETGQESDINSIVDKLSKVFSVGKVNSHPRRDKKGYYHYLTVNDYPKLQSESDKVTFDFSTGEITWDTPVQKGVEVDMNLHEKRTAIMEAAGYESISVDELLQEFYTELHKITRANTE